MPAISWDRFSATRHRIVIGAPLQPVRSSDVPKLPDHYTRIPKDSAADIGGAYQAMNVCWISTGFSVCPVA